MGMVPPFLDNPHEPQLEINPNSPVNGLYWPIALIIATLIVFFLTQLSAILTDRSALKATYDQQEPVIQGATHMRRTLDVVAEGVSRLSARGNANAKQFIVAMAKKGITIRSAADETMKPEAASSAPVYETIKPRPPEAATGGTTPPPDAAKPTQVPAESPDAPSQKQ